MPTINILDESYAMLTGINSVEMSALVKEYSHYAPNFRFSPAYKMGRWNGKIKLLSVRGVTYVNLLDDIIQSLYSLGYTEPEIKLIDNREYYDELYNIEPVKADLFDGYKWKSDDDDNIVLRDYQITAINRVISNVGGIMEISTGGGKTLICAALAKVYSELGRFVLIVPSVDLVLQTKSTFEKCGLKCGLWYADIKDEQNIIISTWQSLKNTKELLDTALVVLVDECHLAKAKVITELVADFGKGVPVKIGCTGTLPEHILSKLQLRGLLGNTVMSKESWELQEEGTLADIQITQCRIKDPVFPYHLYDDGESITWKDEVDWLYKIEGRNEKIIEIIKKTNITHGNTLVLVPYLYFIDMFKQIFPDDFYVHGKVKPKIRTEMFKKMNELDNGLMFATYQTASTGIDIPRLHSIVMIEGGKSFERIIQSIGRGIRKGVDKDKVYIYDIGSTKNTSVKHAKKRMIYYNKKRYTATIEKI